MGGRQICVPHARKPHEKFPLKKSVSDVFLDPADMITSKQKIYVCKTLFYEKENKPVSRGHVLITE